MRKSLLNNSFRASLLGLGAVAVLAAGPAGADTPVWLPDGHDQFTAADGVTVLVDRVGEHALISGSMAASPLSRNVWVSGTTIAHVRAPRQVNVTGGTIETGYLLGCQVDLGRGGQGGIGAAGTAFGQYGSIGGVVTPYTDLDLSLTLAPGKVVGVKVDSFDFAGLSGTTEYVDHTLAIEGCAGYAQARAYTTVTVHDNVMDAQQTLWGQPFSIG
jgi:hypothetical protein